VADAYPTADSLKDWPVNTVRRLSPERDLYGLKFTLADKTIVGISTFDRLLRLIIAAVHDMQDNMVGVRVYDNFGQCIIGDAGLEGKPFMTLTPGKYLPDFKVDVFFRDHSVFENAASRQTAVYTWTGILVVVLIVTSGTLAARAIGRQAKLNRLKNDFIATISHELKTPLSSMRVLVDTLLEGRYRDQTQATEYLQLVSKENQRLSRLIDNFLTFSRMERNKRAFEFAEVEPNDIVRDAVGTIRDRFESAGCRLNIELASELPTINADRDAMVTVLLNLLDNAYKYSENDKQITIRTYSTDRSVCFEVADKGIGLSRRDTKRVFNRFYQVDQSLSRRTGGCGLGLSIVKFIVDAHGGTIDVQSRLGQGSTFAVTLPAEIHNKNI
jgi:signal transduction histidine kinase